MIRQRLAVYPWSKWINVQAGRDRREYAVEHMIGIL